MPLLPEDDDALRVEAFLKQSFHTQSVTTGLGFIIKLRLYRETNIRELDSFFLNLHKYTFVQLQLAAIGWIRFVNDMKCELARYIRRNKSADNVR